ncbi:MAG: metal-sulfur cluster assembly factor [Solirubrobacteraceae bacterium]
MTRGGMGALAESASALIACPRKIEGSFGLVLVLISGMMWCLRISGYTGAMSEELEQEHPAVTVDDVLEALSNVIDPELGLDFVELGLIYGVEVDGGDVEVTFTLTTPACPIGPHVTEQMEEFVGELEGVESVECKMVFTPAWSPEKMTEDAKFALGF